MFVGGPQLLVASVKGQWFSHYVNRFFFFLLGPSLEAVPSIPEYHCFPQCAEGGFAMPLCSSQPFKNDLCSERHMLWFDLL